MHKGIGIWLDSMYISQNQGFQPPRPGNSGAARARYGTNQHTQTGGKRSRPQQMAKEIICRHYHSMADWPLSVSRRWIASSAGSAGKWQYSSGE